MRDGLHETGDVIAGKYVVELVLGRGGMGTVYGVTHRLTAKRLALKCLLPTYVDNPSVVERFLREARTAGQIQHRHVIDVFDAGREDDVLYIVMPWLDGRPLADLLQDERLTLEETLVIMVRAMEGVAAAHALGILHRDLKPGNIFVCLGVSGRLDDPRILDFGISKLQDELGSPLTRSGTAVGTPYYMPLEQLTGQRDLDQRVDVYALGVILYEAMTGRPPHRADNIAALALELKYNRPRHLRQLRADLPEGLADLVMRALEQEREARFPSVRALVDALVPFIPHSAGLTLPEPKGSPLRTPRDTDEAVLGEELARASATTAPSTPPPPSAAAEQAPSRTTPLPSVSQESIAPKRHSAARRVRRVAVAAAAICVAVGLVYGTRRMLEAQAPASRAREQRVQAVASASPGDEVPGTRAPSLPSESPGIRVVQALDASVRVPPVVATAPVPTKTVRLAHLRRATSGDAGTASQHQPGQLDESTDAKPQVPTPTSEPATPGSSRGVELAPDEF